MATGKKSFVLYCDYKELFDELSDVDSGQLIKHIFNYVNDENPISENPIVKASFILIKQQLKRDLKKFESICERNKINGAKGGRPLNSEKATGLNENPIKPKKPTGLIEKPKKPDNDNDNDNDNDSDIDNDSDNEIKENNTCKQKSLHSILREDFEKWYFYLKKIQYYWKAKDAKALHQTISQLKFSIRSENMEDSDEHIRAAFRNILKSNKDKWITDNLSMSIINSKYNEIIAKIKSSPENLRQRIIREMQAELEKSK